VGCPGGVDLADCVMANAPTGAQEGCLDADRGSVLH
jgi:hypothetical protein